MLMPGIGGGSTFTQPSLISPVYLDLAYTVTISYLLPEIVTPSQVFMGDKSASESGCYSFFTEEKFGDQIDTAPLKNRFSTAQQVRELFDLALQRVCCRFPDMAQVFVGYNPSNANKMSINLQGVAMLQAITANVWNLMQRENQRLVFFVVPAKSPQMRQMHVSTAGGIIESIAQVHQRRKNGGRVAMGNGQQHGVTWTTCEGPLVSRFAMMKCLANVMLERDIESACCIGMPLPTILSEDAATLMNNCCPDGSFPRGA